MVTGGARKTGRKSKNSNYGKMIHRIWIWSQISISRNEKWKNLHFLSHPMIFNVKVWFFFGHFWLPMTFETSSMQQPQPLARSSKRVWIDISNRPGEVRLTRLDPIKNSSLMIRNGSCKFFTCITTTSSKCDYCEKPLNYADKTSWLI